MIHQHIDSDGSGSAPFELKNRYLYANMVDIILADELVGVPDSSATVSVGIGGGTATQPNQVLWPLTDHQGSVRTILNHSREVVERRVYDTVGNRVLPQSGNGGGSGSSGPGEPGGNPGGATGMTNSIAVDHLFGYTGREWDSDIGLQYNRARWYDHKQGRWISQDPIGFAAGDENLYRYVGNGPTNATDPSGLFEEPPLIPAVPDSNGITHRYNITLQGDRRMDNKILDELARQNSTGFSRGRYVWHHESFDRLSGTFTMTLVKAADHNKYHNMYKNGAWSQWTDWASEVISKGQSSTLTTAQFDALKNGFAYAEGTKDIMS